MPWRQVDVMTERFQFIRDARRRLVTFTELCALYGVSRFTGYKWLHRAEHSGLDYLQELSRRPHQCPTRPRRPSRRGCSRHGGTTPPGARASCWRSCGGRTGAGAKSTRGLLGAPWPSS